MAPFLIAALAIAVLTGMSMRANRWFRDERRLPMQWWLDSSVTWTAPRRWALAFMPILATVTLVPLTIISATTAPRPGQEELAIPAFVLMAATLIAIHALHLWLMRRTVDRRG
ncbi:hypothetical protein [Sphingomonas sp.]|uniref:hypothetical protein n=1 Tax=Sphingomonas sp. TaxID=28214 RepID=UPI002C88E1C0|nr:hypothetical protein [Sphingomonas sp.]HTG38084.1 hypothetical protein [Sphingomonas sp.]